MPACFPRRNDAMITEDRHARRHRSSMGHRRAVGGAVSFSKLYAALRSPRGPRVELEVNSVRI